MATSKTFYQQIEAHWFAAMPWYGSLRGSALVRGLFGAGGLVGVRLSIFFFTVYLA